jgi:replicative DNA helicase
VSANIEHQLVCKIIETRDFHTVEKLKIDETFFLGDPMTLSQTREVFKFIRDHFHNPTTFGSVPSWELLQYRFAGFPWVGSHDTLPTLCQEARRYKLRAQILTIVDEITRTVDVDPHVAMNSIREAASTLVSQHDISNDLLLSTAHERLLQEYEMVQNGHGIIGIPWPWDVLNEDTQGMQKGQFIVVYGRPKSMKSWVSLYIACNAYMRGARVLIYSLEMSPIMVQRRCAALMAQVEYSQFKNSKLDPATKERVFAILQYLRSQETNQTTANGHQPALLATQPDGETSGISSLHAKIREFSPDLVIVDGMYLMKDDRQKARNIDWKSVAHISQDLKRTAASFNIPVLAVTQANRGADKDPRKADLAELAYADALGQDCDLCMRVHKQKDTMTHEDELVLSFPGSREGKLEAFVINGVPAVNFHFKRAQISDPNNPDSSAPPTGGGGGGGHGKGGGGGVRATNVPIIVPQYGSR